MSRWVRLHFYEEGFSSLIWIKEDFIIMMMIINVVVVICIIIIMQKHIVWKYFF